MGKSSSRSGGPQEQCEARQMHPFLCSVAQADGKLVAILLPLPPGCYDYWHMPLHSQVWKLHFYTENHTE